MKVITLKQPWATLVAQGIKKYEFRSWKTNYRGKILLHAGAAFDKDGMKSVENLGLHYPTKRIIAIVEIVDCIKLDAELNEKIIAENNIAYGDKIRSGYAWKIENVEKILLDKEVAGKLGLWNIDID